MANFVNPYNFIRLSNDEPRRGRVRKGDLIGVITFSLRTRTPLVIPNTSNTDVFKVKNKEGEQVDEHKSYDFFSYDDLSTDGRSDDELKDLFGKDGTRKGVYSEPVIPGSEIRGMIRNYYEILTNSCMSFVDDDEVLSKRTNEVFKPGLLERKEDGTFVLYKGEDCLLRGEGDKANGYEKIYRTVPYREGQKVFFTYKKREGMNEKGRYVKAKPLAFDVRTTDYDNAKTGYIIKGEAGPEVTDPSRKYTEKHNCHIFIRKGAIKELDSKEIKTLNTVLDMYKENGESEYKEYRNAWSAFKKGEGEDLFPVYYSQFSSNASYMLSPGSITREIYNTKLKDIIGKHCACSEQDELCPACALFGMLGKEFHVTSRLRFADVRLQEKSYERFADEPGSIFMDQVTLETLNTPKLNNMEFYLKRPDNAWFWTYDYYVDDRGVAHAYNGSPEINGRKFYWHQPDMTIKNADPEKINATVRPLSAGVEFIGKVYFDHLSKSELDMLIYAIEAGDKGSLKEKRQCYKLGHAKPLGYGSIALHVDRVDIRTITLDDGNKTVSYAINQYDESDPALDPDIEKNFAIMTDFELLRGKNVSYPKLGENEPEIFKWFVNNHGGYNHSNGKAVNMPNSRLQMTYREHMYALEPELRSTGAPLNTGGQSNRRPSGNKSNNYRPNKNPVVRVEVKRITRNGGIAFDDNGKEGLVSGKKVGNAIINIGDIISVKFSYEKEFDDGNVTRFYDLVK